MNRANPASSKQEVIRDVGMYSFASLITQVIGLVVAVLCRKFLGPVQMGVWAIVQICVEYSAYSTFGVSDAAPREIPYHIGKGEPQAADRIKNAVFSFGTLSAAIVAAGFFGFALIARGRIGEVYFWGMLCAGTIVILQRINNLLIVFLRAFRLFSLASRQMILSAIVNSVLVAVLAYRFRIYGFMAALCLSYVFNIIYILWASKMRLSWAWDWKEIRRLIGYGLPLQGAGALNTVFSSLDRLSVASVLGVRALGLYGIAIMGYQYLASFPNSVSTVLVSHFHEKFGQRGILEDLKGYLFKSTDAFCAAMALLIGWAWLCTPYLIRRLLPDFSEAIVPAQWLLAGSYFMALINPFSTFLIVARRQWALMVMMAGFCVAGFLIYPVMTRHYGLLGTVSALAGMVWLRFAIVFVMAGRTLFPSQIFLKGLVIHLKFAFLIGCLAAIAKFLPFSAAPEMLRPLGQSLVLTGLLLPFWIHLNRDLQIIRSMKAKLAGRSV